MYILALDVSLVNTGGSVFDKEGNVIEIFSVPTSSKDSTQVRLKKIADFFIALKKRYEFELVVFEKGFSKFAGATQQIFRVIGVINCLLWKSEQIYIAATTVKKTVTGSGKADKEQVKKAVLKQWKDIEVNNDDESDSLAVGLTYFKQQGIL
jgi:crossover junction endodeoxyribonuclease RuvC